MGRVAAKWAGIPTFFTPHGFSFVNRETGSFITPLLLLEKIALRVGGKIIAVCEAERTVALKCLGINEHDIVTIHNGLPDSFIDHSPADEPVRITMIARFDRQKDHRTLLQALSMLRHLSWELRLAGTGPLLPSVRALVNQLGLSPRVHFLDQCDDIAGLLSKTDIFALTTNWEAFPISVLEAMRSALPVVATDVGGVPEAVEEGVNGFLVPHADPHELSGKLALLIVSPTLRRSMGLLSRKRFSRHFEWNMMLDKTEATYAAALGRPVKHRISVAASA